MTGGELGGRGAAIAAVLVTAAYLLVLAGACQAIDRLIPWQTVRSFHADVRA